ncbi:MAG TPA: hypothetical protein VJ180_00590 [Pyrinomonadaceae bacterium]|jgi:hypothetical protein|nr:hypothetical protein [Pyrinomonadaceae bacterium]
MSDWKSNLSDFFDKQEKKAQADTEKQKETQSEAEKYLATEVAPAFDELKSELEKHGRHVSIHTGADSAGILVDFEGREEFQLTVKTRGSVVYPETRFREKTDGKMYRSEAMFHGSSAKSNVFNVKKDDIIAHFLEDYQRRISR